MKSYPFLAALAMIVVVATVRSDDEKKQAEPAPKGEKKDEAAPAPRAVPTPPVIVMPYHQRINRWDVWQRVAVDQSNQWRPRVIASPYGAYYLYNGKPYPWMPVISTNIQATSVGTPYRAAPAVMPYCED